MGFHEWEVEETYLGGFYSPMQLSVSRPGHWKMIVGAGMYVTTKRLFIFHGTDLDVTISKIATGSRRGQFVPNNLTQEQNREIIKELSANCPPQAFFEKDKISTLQIKEPTGFFHKGLLTIVQSSGESLELGIAKKKESELILRLLKSFGSPVLREL